MHRGGEYAGLQTILTPIQGDIVAIIEDDPGVRKAMATLLSTFGYVPDTFNSAEAFLSKAATSKAKCLVIDVQLADISGVELARHLADAGFAFPLIFMTSFDDEVILRQAERLGCIAYLRKPFAANLLIEAIARAVGRSP